MDPAGRRSRMVIKKYKKCSSCGTTKPLFANFYKQEANRDGYRGICKACTEIKRKKRGREGERARRKASGAQHNAYYKRHYGLSDTDVELIKDVQGGRCAICNSPERPEIGKAGKLYVDHCHETGEVRGMLCNNCNSGLGQFRDNIESLDEAIRYLEAFDGH